MHAETDVFDPASPTTLRGRAQQGASDPSPAPFLDDSGRQLGDISTHKADGRLRLGEEPQPSRPHRPTILHGGDRANVGDARPARYVVRHIRVGQRLGPVAVCVVGGRWPRARAFLPENAASLASESES